jgi:uncharacterized membrane protein YhfC
MGVNYLYILASLSIFLAGLIPLIIFKYRLNIHFNIIFWGAVAWIVSTLAKFAAASVLNIPLYAILMPLQPLYYIYIGLLAGIFETFIPLYIISKRKKLFTGLKRQLGFGLGFGCFEAIALGVLSMLVFAIVVSVSNVLPPEQLANFSLPAGKYAEAALYGSAERLSAIVIHTFSIMLIFIYVFRKRASYLIGAVTYKTFIDGMAAFFILSPIAFTVLQIETFYGVVAAVTLIALWRIAKR